MRKLTSLAAATILACCGTSCSEPATAEKAEGVRHVDASGASKLLADAKEKEKPLILDVRTPGEFAGGHLEGAVNIDFNGDDFEARLSKLDKSKPCVVY